MIVNPTKQEYPPVDKSNTILKIFYLYGVTFLLPMQAILNNFDYYNLRVRSILTILDA